MQRILAVVLVVLGAAGLILGRLGETIWAPPTERTATVSLKDAGPAVLLDPGLLYVGGEQGTATITADGEISLITAGQEDIAAYMEGTRYTRVTGLSDWKTLTTEVVNPEGAAELPADVATADLWRSVQTDPSPVTVDIAAWAKEETQTHPQPYRAILLVTDGKKPGATSVRITWPVESRNEWVPYAYAGGAAIAVIGLVLLVVSLSSRGRRNETEQDERAPSTRFVTTDGADSDDGGRLVEDLESPTEDLEAVLDADDDPRDSDRQEDPR